MVVKRSQALRRELEREHDPDQEAMDACFAEATEDQGEPYTWSREITFRTENGVLVFENSEGPEYEPSADSY